MTGSPEPPESNADTQDASAASANVAKPTRSRARAIHEVVFIPYPKLLFIWPLIVLGFALWPLGYPDTGAGATAGANAEQMQRAAPTGEAATPQAEKLAEDAEGSAAKPQSAVTTSRRLEVLGWIYIWVAVFVLLTLGIDVDRNQAAFWVILVGLIWVLGVWLRDSRGFTLFGDIYRWFAGLDVRYDRSYGLALSVILLVPFVLMLIWARINDRWRITHNEFEHYSFGKTDDSLGRGAKTIRTSFPDVFELLLGLAGTLIVYNATGTKELRRIPHVMFLPMVRKRLNRILERTAITAAQMEEEEEDDEDM